MICPNQCVCQYSHLMDLSIARWMNSFETAINTGQFMEKNEENLVNDNEVK